MHAIMLAGGTVNPGDPLFTDAERGLKCLIEVGGRPIAGWVLAALRDSAHVDDVIVVGLPEGSLDACGSPAVYLADQGSLIGNARFALSWLVERYPDSDELIVSTGDIPLLTGKIVNWMVENSRPFDRLMVYPVVRRQVMMSQYPTAGRTYTKLKEIEGAGGDLVVIRSQLLQSDMHLWEDLTNARKHPWKVARVVGLRTLLKLILRRLSISDVEALGQKLLGGRIRVLESPHAAIAMDVDKPHQLRLVRSLLEKER